MSKGAYQRRDITAPAIRFYCPECHKLGTAPHRWLDWEVRAWRVHAQPAEQGPALH